jgi:hypothetical protein
MNLHGKVKLRGFKLLLTEASFEAPCLAVVPLNDGPEA